MDLNRTPPDVDAEPQPTTVPVTLWPDDRDLFDQIRLRTGLEASEVFRWGLGAVWRELEGIVLPPPEPGAFVDMEQVLRESEEDVKAGRVYTNEEVFAELRAKFGR